MAKRMSKADLSWIWYNVRDELGYMIDKYCDDPYIDQKHCRKTQREIRKIHQEFLKLPMFNHISFDVCQMCKTKGYKEDMCIYSEILHEPKGGPYPVELFYICKKCDWNYKRRKTPLYKGYQKGW